MVGIKVLICDDNEPVRVTLARALRYKPGIEVIGEAGSAEELLEIIESLPADVILMDINLPGMTGVEGIAKLREKGIATPVISMSADKRNEVLATSAGATSFFYKGTTDLGVLVADIRSAAGSV